MKGRVYKIVVRPAGMCVQMYRGGGTKDAEGGASRQEEESRATEKTDGGDAEGERRGRVLTQHTCQSKQPPPLTPLSHF